MSTVMSVRPGQPRCRIAPAAINLIESARRGLADAAGEAGPGTRYVGAHLAALARRCRDRGGEDGPGAEPPAEGSPQRLGKLLPRVEPALSEWAAFFAAGRQAGRRGGGPGSRRVGPGS